MEVFNDSLFVGGTFSMAGGVAASRIAKWHIPSPPFATVEVGNALLCVGECGTFTDLSPNGVSSRLWQFPGGTPATSTDSIATVCCTAPGSYAVTLTVSNAGGTNSITIDESVVVDVCMGMPTEQGRTALSIWPNPAYGTLSVTWDGQAPVGATLIHATGQLLRTFLLQPGTNVVDVRGLPSGSYMLRTDDGRTLRVVLVE